MACTLWPDKIGPWDFKPSCEMHDKLYKLWRRGIVRRKVADYLFYLDLCVRGVPQPLASVMYYGVRALGWLF